MGHLRNGILVLILTFCTLYSQAQEQSSSTDSDPTGNTPVLSDSVGTIPDSAAIQGTAPGPSAKSEINTTINYQAKDSIDFDVINRILYLYGDAKIDYGTIKLDAAYIKYDWGNNMLTANGVPDSIGRIRGKPLFEDGGESYITDSIRYNFISRKALISGVVTEQGEGIIQADRVKRLSSGAAAMGTVKYTTCNLADPHFHIEANKIMMLPGDKIISGPFHLEVANIPTPLGFLFGLFPVQKPNEAGSGIIIPKYGEEARRGFFLRDGGYYFAINEYMDARLTGDIYSKGSYALNLATRYQKRYAYRGSLNVQYSNQRLSDNIEDTTRNSDIWVRWSHSPETRGNNRLSASVNAGTSGFNRLNPETDLRNTLRREFNSNVSYSTTFFQNRMNFSTNFRLNQNVATRKADILLPEVALGLNRIYPFKRAGSSGKTWYEKVNFSWNFNATNRFTNVLPGVEGENGQDSVAGFTREAIPLIIRNANNGGRHTVPISTSFNIFKHITVSPNINLTEYWYIRELDWRYDSEAEDFVADTIPGFSRAFEYRTAASLTSRLYGTFQTKGRFKDLTGIEAVRHVLIPSMSLSYRPDFSADQFGIYQELTDPTDGTTQTFSRYQGFVFGSPGSGESGLVSFSLNNNLEMKVRDKEDSTGVATKKIPLLENLSLSSSYNFLADEFRLSPIAINTRTKLFDGKVNVNLSTVINPYVWQLDSAIEKSDGSFDIYQTRLDRYAWTEGQGIGSIQSARIAISTSLRPDKNRTRTSIENELGDNADRYMEEEIQDILQNPEYYVDWSVPWNVRINYNIDYSREGFKEPTIRQTLRFSGDLNISENWKVNLNSGLDIQKLKLIDQTNIGIVRNLHCWEMQFDWTPFGAYANYSVDLRVKASLLQDLKLSRRRSPFDR